MMDREAKWQLETDRINPGRDRKNSANPDSRRHVCYRSGMAQGLPLAKYPVLVVDDEQDNLDAIRFNFGKSFQLLLAASGEEALALARAHDVAVIVTDQRMPRMTGLELLKAARELRPDAVGIIVTAFTDVDVLIEAINLGRIYRYVTKPWDSKELRGILTHAIERFALLRENRRLQEQLAQYVGMLSTEAHSEFNFGAIVGDSPALRDVLARVEQVAQTASTVLLLGETGTGKEMVARAIHINSAREPRAVRRGQLRRAAPRRCSRASCSATRRARSPARSARRLGRFELADGGTLFLDEIGELPLDVQVKLLRVLQEREFERVGGDRDDQGRRARRRRDQPRPRARDRRAARFREDLYYRLNVFPIQLPPLRERASDIPLLAEHFVRSTRAAPARRCAASTPRDRRALRLSLARQRPRARERGRARADPRARRRAHRADLEFTRRAPRGRTAAAPGAAPAARRGRAPAQERLHEQERGASSRRSTRPTATSRTPRAPSASTARRSTTGCASTASSTSCP